MDSGTKNFITILCLLFVMSACTPMQFQHVDTASNVKTDLPGEPEVPGESPTPGPSPLPTPPSSPVALKTESFLQDDAAGKVDILIIDDNSHSMEIQQMKMAERFPSFISSLSDLDYQIAVTTTDVDSSGANARFNLSGSVISWGGTSSKVLTSKTPLASTLFNNTIARSETIGCYERGDCPSGNEQAMKATILAMQKRSTDNAGVFRDGVDLAVVVLSNEDEMSSGPSSATSAQAVVDAFKLQFGETKRLRAFGIIIQSGNTACRSAQLAQTIDGKSAYYGTRVEKLAALTGGSTASICDLDYSKSLSAISSSVRKLVGTFELAEIPDPKSVKVTLTPARTIGFHMEGKNLIFDTPPPAGTQIDVSYSPK